MKPCFASIDVGTHTTRLLIVFLRDDRLEPILKKRVVTKLGFYFNSGYLADKGINSLIDTLSQYAQDMKRHEVNNYQAVATAVLREAKNAEELINLIRDKTGIEIKIISGQSEAELTAKGVLSTLEIPKKSSLIVDIGGGSTELIWENDKKKVVSLALGATHLTQSFLKHDPPLNQEIKEAFCKAKEVIQASNFPSPVFLIGTAGSISTLAALDLKMTVYQPHLINGHILTKNSIETIFSTLCSMNAQQRLTLPGLEPGREEIILGGTIIALSLLEVFHQDRMIVSEGGLLEGVLVDYLVKKKGKKYKFRL
ncbi:MAG: hypothetical protein J7J46_10515 [Candidatus Desulfofervidus sp.]|nr:hypothetical protein [Candidatus Desulfofervidus sp.]